jgi:hypothetical protein
MSENEYHPEGFVPMTEVTKEQKWSDDVRALERGLQFFHELKEQKEIKTKPMSFADAEVLIAQHPQLTFAAIRAVEKFHGIL